MEQMIKWFSRNHVAGNFLMMALLIAGLTTWFSLKKEIFPEIAIDAVAVNIPYPNATPEEAERGVCIPVEEAVADLQGIKKSVPPPPRIPEPWSSKSRTDTTCATS